MLVCIENSAYCVQFYENKTIKFNEVKAKIISESIKRNLKVKVNGCFTSI